MKRLLIVERDDDLRAALQDLFELSGFQVFAYAEGETARALLGELDPPPCLVLDPDAPGGAALLREIASRSGPRAVPTVIFSPTPPLAVPKAIVLRKPFNPEVLLETVIRFCEEA